MNNPILYSSGSNFQRYHNQFVLNKYFHDMQMSVRDGDKILDIGCGDGNFTAKFILPKFAQKADVIIGIDISREMIQYALNVHKHPKLQFKQFDIVAESLREQLIERFDHIFSFFCLHWVQEQRKAYKNIYDLLKSNSDILLTLVARHPVFTIYEILAKTPKWKQYMTDASRYITPFQHTLEPQKELRTMLEKIGFRVIVCKCEPQSYIFDDRTACRKFYEAINPFIDRIPNNLKEEYFDNFWIHERKLAEIKSDRDENYIQNKSNENLEMCYDLLTVYAVKN